jgi:hypothetical protein
MQSKQRNVLNYATNATKKSSLARTAIISAVALGLLGGGLVWWNIRIRKPPVITPPTGGINVPAPDIISLEPAARNLQAIRHAIQPCTDDLHNSLQVARERCLNTLADAIDQHRAGILPFIDDLQSISSKLGLVGRAAGDLWNQQVNGRDSKYVRSRVEAALAWHVLSDDKLRKDIQAALEQFANEVQAARNIYYASVRIQLAKLKVELNLPKLDVHIFESNMNDQLGKAMERIGNDVAGSFVASTVTGIVVEEVTRIVLTRVLTGVAAQMATRAATIFAVSGGATVATSTGGAGAGTLAGPAGTAAGFLTGIAVGMAVDWWFDKASAKRIGNELQQLIDAVKAESLKQTAAALDLGIANYKVIQEAAVVTALVEELR